MSVDKKVILDNLQFSNPEAVIRSLSKAEQEYNEILHEISAELTEKRIQEAKIVANAEYAIRSNGHKMTEGYISCALECDPDVEAIRSSVKRLDNEYRYYKACQDSVIRLSGLFSTYLKSLYHDM